MRALNFARRSIVYKPLRMRRNWRRWSRPLAYRSSFRTSACSGKAPPTSACPKLISQRQFAGRFADNFTPSDAVLLIVVAIIMIGLTLLVKFTRLGKSMRAVAQNPVAAQLMGIHVERVIGSTFLIGGALAGFAAVIYSIYIGTIGFQIGYINGLYAFTAAVLGGIGNIPGAVLGGFVIGMIRSLGSAYVEERWTPAIIFGILIVILIFRPSGLLGERTREKV